MYALSITNVPESTSWLLVTKKCAGLPGPNQFSAAISSHWGEGGRREGCGWGGGISERGGGSSLEVGQDWQRSPSVYPNLHSWAGQSYMDCLYLHKLNIWRGLKKSRKKP